MIGIVDYEMGNLYSVSQALKRLKVDYLISDKADILLKTDGLILPGVGSFKQAIQILNEKNLDVIIRTFAQSAKPLLGICLGMQLLFEGSKEHGYTKGLGLLKGEVRALPTGKLKVPHMGWNKLQFKIPHRILASVEEEHVYFVHSYYVQMDTSELVIADSHYGVNIPAIVGNQHVLGMQFHPEKSGKTGMLLLRNFAKLVEERKRSHDIHHLSCH